MPRRAERPGLNPPPAPRWEGTGHHSGNQPGISHRVARGLTSDSASPLPGVSRDVPTAKKNENTCSQKDCVRALTAALGSGPGVHHQRHGYARAQHQTRELRPCATTQKSLVSITLAQNSQKQRCCRDLQIKFRNRQNSPMVIVSSRMVVA